MIDHSYEGQGYLKLPSDFNDLVVRFLTFRRRLLMAPPSNQSIPHPPTREDWDKNCFYLLNCSKNIQNSKRNFHFVLNLSFCYAAIWQYGILTQILDQVMIDYLA